jgi:hydrogenase nickel incorporation protein HypA/HybF
VSVAYLKVLMKIAERLLSISGTRGYVREIHPVDAAASLADSGSVRLSVTSKELAVHELSITESVVAAVTDRLGDEHIEVITLEVGRLSGVVADSIRFCFDLCTEGTSLQGAMLDIIDIPGRAHCRSCDETFEMADQIPLCTCGSTDLEILSGEELRIKNVKVA